MSGAFWVDAVRAHNVTGSQQFRRAVTGGLYGVLCDAGKVACAYESPGGSPSASVQYTQCSQAIAIRFKRVTPSNPGPVAVRLYAVHVQTVSGVEAEIPVITTSVTKDVVIVPNLTVTLPMAPVNAVVANFMGVRVYASFSGDDPSMAIEMDVSYAGRASAPVVGNFV